MKTDRLNKQEFKHLVNKINNNCLNVEYFRKSLFTASFRGSRDLERKKTIYKDKKTTIKVDRSLNQKHRDLLSLLAFEEKSRVRDDGSYFIKTSLYSLAKKMGYKYPAKSTEYVYNLIIDMSKTIIFIKQKNKIYNHSLIGDGYYDEDEDTYIIEVPAMSAKYNIYSTGVSIPQNLNEKIVAIENSKSKIKALVSYILANAKLKNGIYFDTICEKLDITERTAKIKFKKQIIENLELLKEFKIKYENDKFYLKKEKCTFYPALSEKQVLSFEKTEEEKLFEKTKEKLLESDENKTLVTTTIEDEKVKIKVFENQFCFFSENDEFIRKLNDDEVRNLVLFFIKNNVL